MYEQYKKVAELGFGLQHFKRIMFTENTIVFYADYSAELQELYEEFGFEFELGQVTKTIHATQGTVSIYLDLTQLK